MNVPVKIEKINDLAVVPTYAHEGDAGFDLYSTDCGSLKPGETKVFGTGLKMEIPRGYAVGIRPRSGMSLKTSLRITNAPGTIDSVYRGEIGIIIQNTGNKVLHIDIGDRIAQGVLEEIPKADFEVVDSLTETERGSGGFGHTGRK